MAVANVTARACISALSRTVQWQKLGRDGPLEMELMKGGDMKQLRISARHARYVMGSLTAVLFAACAGRS
jgi:hypothetical protein